MNKETQIVRQSQIKVAFELLQSKGISPSLLELCLMTESLSDYIQKGFDPSVSKRLREVDKWMSDKQNDSVQG